MGIDLAPGRVIAAQQRRSPHSLRGLGLYIAGGERAFPLDSFTIEVQEHAVGLPLTDGLKLDTEWQTARRSRDGHAEWNAAPVFALAENTVEPGLRRLFWPECRADEFACVRRHT